ncbi:MAG TPA: hydroxymethylbilane synthase [Fimbriimonadaceae bacterium]|jgi:hydroxymethylbilane synthase
MASRTIRLGTRGSKLALIQATNAKRLLEASNENLEVEIITIKTSGDRGDRNVLGAFVRDIEQELLDGSIDLALHCLKDLPTLTIDGLSFAAYLEREDPRDAILTLVEDWNNLPGGAVIGTGSVRRSAQLKASRPDLQYKPLVGNADTRLRKLHEGEYDAIVLAMAGLNRMGVENLPLGTIVTHLPLDAMLPAPGQAVLVLQCRAEDFFASAVAGKLDHDPTRNSASAERAFMRCFGSGCSVPVAAYCLEIDGHYDLRGLVSSPDGTRSIRGHTGGHDPLLMGKQLGEQLLSQGAGELMADVVR